MHIKLSKNDKISTSIFKALYSCVTKRKNIIKCFEIININQANHSWIFLNMTKNTGSNGLLLVLL